MCVLTQHDRQSGLLWWCVIQIFFPQALSGSIHAQYSLQLQGLGAGHV